MTSPARARDRHARGKRRVRRFQLTRAPVHSLLEFVVAAAEQILGNTTGALTTARRRDRSVPIAITPR
jgi:hypothetical protein